MGSGIGLLVSGYWNLTGFSVVFQFSLDWLFEVEYEFVSVCVCMTMHESV